MTPSFEYSIIPTRLVPECAIPANAEISIPTAGSVPEPGTELDWRRPYTYLPAALSPANSGKLINTSTQASNPPSPSYTKRLP